MRKLEKSRKTSDESGKGRHLPRSVIISDIFCSTPLEEFYEFLPYAAVR